MTQRITNRRRLAKYAAIIVLALVAIRIPAVQNVIASALIEFVEITERTLRLPCAVFDHDKCSSLDRLDPTRPVRRTCSRATTPKEVICHFNSRSIANGSSPGRPCC